MEKLLDLKQEKPNQDPPYALYRFQCDCLDPEEAMDISVEAWGSDNESKYLEINMQFYGTGFLDRIKYAWHILRGNWTWREFSPRPEDYESISKIFDPSKKYSELP